MRDTFLAPFEKVVKQGRVGAIMASYNENSGGLPSIANPWLLKDVLRRDWGFKGLVMSAAAALDYSSRKAALAKFFAQAQQSEREADTILA